MTATDKAQMRLNCLYAAISIMGVNSSASVSMEKKQPRPSTKDVLNEAKKVWGWVSSKKGDDNGDCGELRSKNSCCTYGQKEDLAK